MYFKLWIINIIIGIIFYEICYSKTCCCSEKCQKNDSNKIEVDRSKERFRRESGNESQSIICPSPPHCPMLNYSKQNYSELSPRPKRPSTKLFLSSNCPPFKCPQPPPCPEKTCPSSLPRQAEKICTPPPPCLKKVCPPPPPCPKTVCPILTPLPLSHSDKPCPPPSPPCPSMTQRSDNGYDFKNVSEKEEKRKSKEMDNRVSNDCCPKYRTVKQHKYLDITKKATSLMEQKNYHSIVRRSTADITNESLSNFNETSTPFFCNDERLKAIMLANMDVNPIISKELIQKAAETEFNEDFNVICSTDTFAYVTYSDTYCEVNDDMVTCYAFKTG